MAQNFAVGLPHDKNGEPQQNSPANFLAKEEWYSDNATTSSVISFTDDTTVIEIGALGAPAAIKWITVGNTNPSVILTTPTASDFDHIIPKDTFRRFVLPIETSITNPQSIQGVNKLNGLYQRVAYKSFGVASITLTEH